jgi:hypothetical protein
VLRGCAGYPAKPDIRSDFSYPVGTGYHYPGGGLDSHCRYRVKLMMVPMMLIMLLVCVKLEMDKFLREPTIYRIMIQQSGGSRITIVFHY